MNKKYDAIVLFSGGLDSLLTARLLEKQGLSILCLHFFSPFFGNPHKIQVWKDCYGLDIEGADASKAFVSMLAHYPPSGTGRTLNPCVDCKITLLKLAKEALPRYNATFIATGEVLGQRPMSQRSDTLNAISRDSGCADILLRPLCAQLLPPTPMEESGLVDRSRLLRISGRGRNDQLALARSMEITTIPTPGGGCRLTETEPSRRYWQLLRERWQNRSVQDLDELTGDFWAANLGRVLFRSGSGHMLCIGRNEKDNARIAALRGGEDLLIRLPFPGPLALARRGKTWPMEEVTEAAAVAAAYAPRARGMKTVEMRLVDGTQQPMAVAPTKHEDVWRLPSWDEAHAEIKICRKTRMAECQGSKRTNKQS